jgi:hypothetical protein
MEPSGSNRIIRALLPVTSANSLFSLLIIFGLPFLGSLPAMRDAKPHALGIAGKIVLSC